MVAYRMPRNMHQYYKIRKGPEGKYLFSKQIVFLK